MFNGDTKSHLISDSSVTLNEGLTVTSTPGNINSYFNTSQNEEFKDLNINQNGVTKETEAHIFQGQNEMFPKISQSFSPPIAAFPSFRMAGSASNNNHYSEVASAKDFFDNISSNIENKLSSNEINLMSNVKERNVEVIASSEFNIPSSAVEISGNEHLNNVNISHQLKTNIFQNPEELNQLHGNSVNQNSENSSSIETDSVENNMKNTAVDVHAEEIPQEKEIQLVPETTQVVEDVLTSEPATSVRSTSENLRQLSQQMNGLIEESLQKSSVGGEDNELERRNQELAALLANEKQKTEQLELQLKEYVSNFFIKLQI